MDDYTEGQIAVLAIVIAGYVVAKLSMLAA